MSSSPDITDLSPAELIIERSRAFGRADFGFIFDSYHSQATFRSQFGDRNEYIQFGWASLGKEFRIRRCEVIREESGPAEARVIFLLEMEVNGTALRYAELAWLRHEERAWRYHRGQRMEAEQLPEDVLTLDFIDFDRLEPKIIF